MHLFYILEVGALTSYIDIMIVMKARRAALIGVTVAGIEGRICDSGGSGAKGCQRLIAPSATCNERLC